MSELIIQSSSVLRPLPRLDLSVRPATLADLSFIDSLQKKHTKMVGWMPTKQLEGKIGAGQVLIAEEGGKPQCPSSNDQQMSNDQAPGSDSALCPHPSALGYCIGHDQYFKRDDVGIIYQMNVVPGKQRGLIGASLLKAQFERSAWGCKLYCCWCAQDIAANYFWESMGFVPLAFRTGGRGQKSEGRGQNKARTHIFWQRRIRAGDETTPWWFPSQTSSGAIREDRLVLPIPPGVRWSDEMPRVLPEERSEVRDQKSDGGNRGASVPAARTSDLRPLTSARKTSATASTGGLRFSSPGNSIEKMPLVKAEKPTRAPREKRKAVKNDPKLIAAARELRDRWLEEVNAGRYLPASAGKYEIARCIEQRGGEQRPLMLNAA